MNKRSGPCLDAPADLCSRSSHTSAQRWPALQRRSCRSRVRSGMRDLGSDLRRHRAEHADVPRHRRAGRPAERAVTGADEKPARPRLGPRPAARERDARTLLPFSRQVGRILQVAVREHDRITAAEAHRRRACRVVTEVARRVHHAHVRVVRRDLAEDLRAAVAAAVVDEHHLDRVAGSRSRRGAASRARADFLLREDHTRDGYKRHSARRSG